MSHYKFSFTQACRFLIFGLVTMNLTACLRGASSPSAAPEGSESSGSDFRVVRVNGQAIGTSRNNHWKIPTEKTYEFNICLESRVTFTALPPGQKFRIQAQNGTIVEDETNDRGCIQYKEIVPFNYTADSMYIERKRKIVGTGTFRGTIDLHYAINPWVEYRSESLKEVVDLNRESSNIPEDRIIKEEASEGALAGYFSRGGSGNKLLIDLSPNLNIIDAGDLPDGKLLDIILQLKPYIEPLDMNGDKSKEYLMSGKFRVFVQLLSDYVGETENQKKVLLTTELEPKTVSINTDGVIEYKSKGVPLKMKVPTGQVQLAVRVVPVETPSTMDLELYDGLYQMGPFRGIYGKKWLTNIEGTHKPEGFNYSYHLKNDTSNYQELKNSTWAMRLNPVDYSDMEPRFVQIQPGETNTHRTVIYRVSTRVRDGVTGDEVREQPFDITLPDGKVIRKNTNHEGLLRWNAKLPHKYYYREHRKLEKVKINHVRSKNSRSYIIALNPWDEGWTFGADLRSEILDLDNDGEKDQVDWEELSTKDGALTQLVKTIQDKVAEDHEKKPNLLFIDAFRYQTIRFRYVIDEYMTLNVKKAVVMALDPLVQRDTLYRGRVFEPLRDGVYLAKIALVKYFIDPFQNGYRLVKCDPVEKNCKCPEGAERCDEEKDGYHVGNVSQGGDFRKGQYTTVIKKLIRVQAGRITTPLEFSMRDLRMMSIRSQIMVQLETIDERSLLRDNIVEQKLKELERFFMTINPETMSDEEKEMFQARWGTLPENVTEAQRERMIQEYAAEIREQQDKLADFIADTQVQLEERRAQQREAQVARFKLAESMKENLAQKEYEKEDPLIGMLKRKDWRGLITNARNNLPQMEVDMKNRWDGWEQRWVDEFYDTYDNPNKDHPYFDVGNKQFGVHTIEHVEGQRNFERTYFDYLSTMQTFVKKMHLPAVITDDDRERMRINNYTQNPVAPLVDLDLYRTKSGLLRRTFIGPCTLVENDNMSEMRPTDTVDEKFCDRIDCGQTLYEPRTPLPDNRKFEESAHHDSLKPFASMHVDDVIPVHRENERRYYMEMEALSQMGNFVRSFNLTYVSLNDAKPLKVYKEGCQFDGSEECVEEINDHRMASQSFVDDLNEESISNLLGRYFLVNDYKELYNVSEKVVQEDSLEPIWNRTKNSGTWITSFFAKDDGDINIHYDNIQDFGHHKFARKYWRDEYEQDEIRDSKVDAGKVSGWLASGFKEMSLEDSLRLCYAMGKQSAAMLNKEGLVKSEANQKMEIMGPDYMVRQSSKSSLTSPLTALETFLVHKCFSKIAYLPKTQETFLDGIHFEKRYKIEKAGSYEHIRGMNMNINVGIDFGISTYEDISTSRSLGFSDAGATLGVAGATVGAFVGGPIGAGVGAVLGVVAASVTNSSTDGVGKSQGTSVNAATFLVVQKTDFDINILEHEKCMVANYGRSFIDDIKPKQIWLKNGNNVKDKKVRDALTRGFMICDGVTTPNTEENPEKIRESYYYVTQHFTAGDMLDDVNLLNHVWLLALRGQRDFNEFVRILKSKKIGSNGEVIEDGEIYDYPLSRLGHVYNDVIPTFPGLYSVQD